MTLATYRAVPPLDRATFRGGWPVQGQTALAKAYPRWWRIKDENPESYVRKIMINTW
jgi:hypothetical protein